MDSPLVARVYFHPRVHVDKTGENGPTKQIDVSHLLKSFYATQYLSETELRYGLQIIEFSADHMVHDLTACMRKEMPQMLKTGLVLGLRQHGVVLDG